MVTCLPLQQTKPVPDEGCDNFAKISRESASHEEAVLLEQPISSSSSPAADFDARDSLRLSSAAGNEEPVHSSWNTLPRALEVQGITLPPSKQMTLSSPVMNPSSSSNYTTAGTSMADENNNNSDDNIVLCRNGYGVRTVRAPFGITIHVYVATLYTLEPIRQAQAVNSILFPSTVGTSSGGQKECAFVMEFTFLRDITPSQMSIAWNYQLDTSVMMPIDDDNSGVDGVESTDNSDDYYTSDGQYDKDRALFLELLDGPMVEKGTIRLEFRGEQGMAVINQGQFVGTIPGIKFQKAFSSMWFGDRPVMEEIKEGLLQGDSLSDESEGTLVAASVGEVGDAVKF